MALCSGFAEASAVANEATAGVWLKRYGITRDVAGIVWAPQTEIAASTITVLC